MTRVYDGVCGQPEELFTHPFNQGIKIAPGKIGPANRTGKEDITNEQVAVT
jgi:hypothetical protein